MLSNYNQFIFYANPLISLSYTKVKIHFLFAKSHSIWIRIRIRNRNQFAHLRHIQSVCLGKVRIWNVNWDHYNDSWFTDRQICRIEISFMSRVVASVGEVRMRQRMCWLCVNVRDFCGGRKRHAICCIARLNDTIPSIWYILYRSFEKMLIHSISRVLNTLGLSVLPVAWLLLPTKLIYWFS